MSKFLRILIVVIVLVGFLVPASTVLADKGGNGNGHSCEPWPSCKNDNGGSGGGSGSNPDGGGYDKPNKQPPQGDQHDNNNGNGNDPDGCDDNNGRKKKCDQQQPPEEPPVVPPVVPPGEPPVIPPSVPPEEGLPRGEGESAETTQLPWCPGDLLAVDRDLKDYDRDIVIYCLDRSSMKPIGEINVTMALGPGEDSHPSISFDGRYVAWSRQVGKDQPVLWVARTDGSHAEKVQTLGVPLNGIHPDWSPVDNQIAYVDPISFRVMIFSLDTKDFRFFDEGENPDWSLDGQWLAYISLEGDYLHLASTVRGKFQVFDQDMQVCITPRWSPDRISVDCVTSWDHPNIDNLNFASVTAQKVDEALDISRDPMGTQWTALIVANAGHQMVLKNLANGQVTYQSSHDEQNPDWWSSKVVETSLEVSTSKAASANPIELWIQNPQLFK